MSWPMNLFEQVSTEGETAKVINAPPHGPAVFGIAISSSLDGRTSSKSPVWTDLETKGCRVHERARRSDPLRRPTTRRPEELTCASG